MAEYIERAAVEKMLENAGMITDGEYSGYYADDILLNDIPSADVAPVRHGRWENDNIDMDVIAYCSECKECYDCADGGFDLFAEYYHYCPNCGAKMDGEG